MAKKSINKARYELTRTEEQLLELLEQNYPLEQAGAHLNMADPERRLGEILSKMSNRELLAKYPIVYSQLKTLDSLEIGFEVEKEAKEAGFRTAFIDRLLMRIRRMPDMPEAPGELNDRQLESVIKQKLAMALSFMDEVSFAGATAKDLAGIVDTLITDIHLIQGKPTSIVSIDDRRKINELLPLLVEEAQRRGVVIDGEFSRQQ